MLILTITVSDTVRAMQHKRDARVRPPSGDCESVTRLACIQQVAGHRVIGQCLTSPFSSQPGRPSKCTQLISTWTEVHSLARMCRINPNAGLNRSSQKHLRCTIAGPDSSYSCLEIHICWKVESDERIEPPIQTCEASMTGPGCGDAGERRGIEVARGYEKREASIAPGKRCVPSTCARAAR